MAHGFFSADRAYQAANRTILRVALTLGRARQRRAVALLLVGVLYARPLALSVAAKLLVLAVRHVAQLLAGLLGDGALAHRILRRCLLMSCLHVLLEVGIEVKELSQVGGSLRVLYEFMLKQSVAAWSLLGVLHEAAPDEISKLFTPLVGVA